MPERFQPRRQDDMRESEDGEYVNWLDWLMEHGSRVTAQQRVSDLEAENERLKTPPFVSTRYLAEVTALLADISAERDDALRKLDSMLADWKWLRDCTETEMGDGDAAREMAAKWLSGVEEPAQLTGKTSPIRKMELHAELFDPPLE